MPNTGVSVPLSRERSGETWSAQADSHRKPGSPIAGRHTVTIRGRGAERTSYTAATGDPVRRPHSVDASRRRPARPRHERPGFRPDRMAMWAVLLGFVLVLVATTSSHAAILIH